MVTGTETAPPSPPPVRVPDRASQLAHRHLAPLSPRHLHVRPGVRLAYLDEGQGEPLVMLHGNPTWSFYYRNLVLGLRDRYRCIVPDHIGCGLSDTPGEDVYAYTLQSRVDDLDTLLESLQVRERITLVLHDWGGMIGMAWASRHPERVRRLVVLNTSCSLLPPGKKLPWQIALVRDTLLGSVLVRGLNLFVWGLTRHCSVRELAPEVRAGYLAPYDSWGRRLAVLRFVQDIPLKPGDPSFALVRGVMDGLERFREVPLLVCWGEKDFVFDSDFLGVWRDRFPAAEVHTFPRAGHLVLEDVGPEVLAHVNDFLLRHPVGP